MFSWMNLSFSIDILVTFVNFAELRTFFLVGIVEDGVEMSEVKLWLWVIGAVGVVGIHMIN